MNTHEVHHDVVIALYEILEVCHRERHRVLPVLVRQLSEHWRRVVTYYGGVLHRSRPRQQKRTR